MKNTNTLILSGCSLLILAQAANAILVPDRFAPIARQNAFRLQPKTEVIVFVPLPERPRIALQGVTTILGRAQVLLSIQNPIKPGAASATSYLLTEGENRDGVVVLEIDVNSGTIRLNNNGEEQFLRFKG